MQRANQNVSVVSRFLSGIAKKMHVEKVFLFGSRAKGTFHAESDFDLLVVSKDFEGVPWHLRAKDMYVAWTADYPVEFLCLTPEEFERKKTTGFYAEVAKNGVPVTA